MATYVVQGFHDVGVWQTLGDYTGYRDAATAMRVASRLGSGRAGRQAFPLGLRVIGPDGWKSQVLGGRPNIRILHDPLTDQWVSGCRNCPVAVNGNTAYSATEFARRHVCGNEEELNLAPRHEGRLIKMRNNGPREH